MSAVSASLSSLRLQAPSLPVIIHLFGSAAPLSSEVASDPHVSLVTHAQYRPYESVLSPLSGTSGDTLYVLAGARLAPAALSWVAAAREKYSSRPDTAAFFLDFATARSRNGGAGKDHEPATWKAVDVGEAENAFLYRLAVGGAAFVPNGGLDLDVWGTFAEWLKVRRADWYKYPTGPGVDDTPLGMSALPESNWTRAAWNVWFSKFLEEYKLNAVYPNLHGGHALTWHPERDFARDMRIGKETALYEGDGSWVMSDVPAVYASDGQLEEDVRFKEENVQRIVELGRQQGGVVSFTMVNKIFLDTARSWLCNVDVGGMRPRGLLWAVTDEETRDAMAAIPDSHTVLLEDAEGGKETGHEFGNPGYWKLMLERTALIGEILRNGVAVFAFETDAIWLEDPAPYIQELVRQNADIVGTINTRTEVSGNFFYLRPTLATRRMWDEITNEFEKAYNNAQFEKKKADSWTYIENDQSLLTKLVLRNETWRRSYPLSFLTLDMERFTDGRWYKPEEGFYTSERAREPVVINNNFVIGVEEKTTRAKKWGHWFWDEKENKCLDSVVLKAVRKGVKAASDETGLLDGHDGAHTPRRGS